MQLESQGDYIIFNEFGTAVRKSEITSINVETRCWVNVTYDNSELTGYFCRKGPGEFYKSTVPKSETERAWSSDIDYFLAKNYHSDQSVKYSVIVNFSVRDTKGFEIMIKKDPVIVHLDDKFEFKEELKNMAIKTESETLKELLTLVCSNIEDTKTYSIKE